MPRSHLCLLIGTCELCLKIVLQLLVRLVGIDEVVLPQDNQNKIGLVNCLLVRLRYSKWRIPMPYTRWGSYMKKHQRVDQMKP